MARNSKTLHLPRILCLHGGGVTAAIFRAQSASLIECLADFRLVFADGPFDSEPGPGMIPRYREWAPFKRWLRWLPKQPAISDEVATEKIFEAIETARCADEGDGPWVGLLGFSQGAKIASSLLYEQQIRSEKESHPCTSYQFAVLLACRPPLVSLGPHSKGAACVGAGDVNEVDFTLAGPSPHILRLPTIHVHGLKDPGVKKHREMMEQYHDSKSVTVIEWSGGHRVPTDEADVKRIAESIHLVARTSRPEKTLHGAGGVNRSVL